VKKFAGFQVLFTQAVDPTTATSSSSYTLTSTVKQGKKLIQRSVPYHATLSSSGSSVTLLFTSKTSPFALGGRLVVTTGVLGASGLPLAFARTYVISAGAKSIH
jgi:hypothetical protein